MISTSLFLHPMNCMMNSAINKYPRLEHILSVVPGMRKVTYFCPAPVWMLFLYWAGSLNFFSSVPHWSGLQSSFPVLCFPVKTARNLSQRKFPISPHCLRTWCDSLSLLGSNFNPSGWLRTLPSVDFFILTHLLIMSMTFLSVGLFFFFYPVHSFIHLFIQQIDGMISQSHPAVLWCYKL